MTAAPGIFPPGAAAPLPPPVSDDEPYSYEAEFLNLAALATVPVDVPIEADSDFYCTMMTAIAGVGNPPTDLAVTAFVPALVTLKSSASGADWSNLPVPWTSYFGRGDQKDFYPFRWQPYKRIQRNSNFRVILANLDNVNQIRARITFHGFKRYT
jgi:hypothetical protein